MRTSASVGRTWTRILPADLAGSECFTWNNDHPGIEHHSQTDSRSPVRNRPWERVAETVFPRLDDRPVRLIGLGRAWATANMLEQSD